MRASRRRAAPLAADLPARAPCAGPRAFTRDPRENLNASSPRFPRLALRSVLYRAGLADGGDDGGEV